MEHRWINRQSRQQGRHPIDESPVQKAVRAAVAKAGLTMDRTIVQIAIYPGYAKPTAIEPLSTRRGRGVATITSEAMP